jgi:hypothetical protein
MSADYNEFDVRELRDLVFEVPATDRGWNACRDNWMRPESVAWLQRESQKKSGNMPLLVVKEAK